MLTGNLLMFRFQGGRFKIRFVETDETDLLHLAQSLIDCFADAAARGMTRNALEEALELFRRNKELKVVDGLIKLLMDRAVFSPRQEMDYPALREKIFSNTAQLLADAGGDWQVYQQRIAQIRGENTDLYGDLPGFETLQQFPFIKAQELLERYNLALAQGMLFYAEKIRIKVSDPEPAEMRRMLKYLKFFRLLAQVVSAGKSSMELEISGPFSLFGPTRKYALNLAVFFPAVVRLKEWKLTAELKINDRPGKLVLDQKSALVSHYRNFSTYVPEEVKLFHRLFAEKVTEWKIVGETPVIHAGKQEFIIPDISFENAEKQLLHLELFHRWHKTQLHQRLTVLAQNDLPLIIGIDRAIMENDEFEEITARNPQLQKRLFRFSDFPGVETVYRLLKKFSH